MMSLSLANGCLRRADSLLGIWDLINWNLWWVNVLIDWNSLFKMLLPTWLNRRQTLNHIKQSHLASLSLLLLLLLLLLQCQSLTILLFAIVPNGIFLNILCRISIGRFKRFNGWVGDDNEVDGINWLVIFYKIIIIIFIKFEQRHFVFKLIGHNQLT